MVDNKDIFLHFIDFCKNHSIEEVIEEFGGGHIYIPSYKTTYRDQQIYDLYKEGKSIRELKKQFSLSYSRIRSIIRNQAKLQEN